MKLLSIIFSFRNEEQNIKELIDRVSSVLNKLNNWKYELIFVNDDSDEILKLKFAGFPQTTHIAKTFVIYSDSTINFAIGNSSVIAFAKFIIKMRVSHWIN